MQQEIIKRNLQNNQDLQEIMEIMNYSLYSKKASNYYVFLWYMKVKGKLKNTDLESFIESFGGNYSNCKEVFFAMDQIEGSVNLFRTPICSTEGEASSVSLPKFSDKIPMINMRSIITSITIQIRSFM